MSREQMYPFPWPVAPMPTIAQPSGAVASLGPGDMPLGVLVSRSDDMIVMRLQYPSGGQEVVRPLTPVGRAQLGVGMHSGRLLAIELNVTGIDRDHLSLLQPDLAQALENLRHATMWAGPQLNYTAAGRALGLESQEMPYGPPQHPIWKLAAMEAMRASDPPSLGRIAR
jgi:hypothetical protein